MKEIHLLKVGILCLIALAIAVMFSSKPAQGHGTPYTESDLNNDRIIVWCNSQNNGGLTQTTVAEAYARWNNSLSQAGLTRYVKFVHKANTNLPCELRTIKTDEVYAYAWIGYYTKPNLIYYPRENWDSADVTLRRFTLMHEIGHGLGLGHADTPFNCWPEQASVMTNWCDYYGAPVPPAPGPHDMDDVRGLWGPGGIAPIN